MNNKVFTLRWRIKEGKVLLFNRHIRELAHLELTAPLIAWVHERIEWAMANMLGSNTDAVLVLNIDPEGEAQASLDESAPAPAFSLEDVRIEGGEIAGLGTGENVWPATVWLAHEDGTFTACTKELFLACDTLTEQLATTQDISVAVGPQAQDALEAAEAVFAVSDEFGYLALKGSNKAADTLQKNLDKLFKA